MSATSSLRGRWRRLALGLPTVLGLRPRGWFIPHRYAPLLPPPGAQPPYPAVEQLFERHTEAFARMLDLVDSRANLPERPRGCPPDRACGQRPRCGARTAARLPDRAAGRRAAAAG